MRHLSLAALSATAALLGSAALAQTQEVPISIDGTPTMVSFAVAVDACNLPEEQIRAQINAMEGQGFTQESTVDLSDPSTADQSDLNNPEDAAEDMNADVAATTTIESTDAASGSDMADASTADQSALNNPTDAEADQAADLAQMGDTTMEAGAATAMPIAPICDITAARASELGIAAN